MGKLIITDLSKLKITKVKDWAIYFNYDNEKYLLHGSCCDYEYGYNLYKRIPDISKNRYKLDCIARDFSDDDCIRHEFTKESVKRGFTYSQIDKEYFVNKLVEWDFTEYNPIKPKIVGVGSNPSPKSKKPQFSKQYDYRSNLEKLKKRYENKCKDIDSTMLGDCDTGYNDGLVDGLETIIKDIEDILDGLDV